MLPAQKLAAILQENESGVLSEWVAEQISGGAAQRGLMKNDELRAQCRSFLKIFVESAQRAKTTQVTTSDWADARAFVAELSRDRSSQGFSPSETVTFVFSLKKPLFAAVRKDLATDPQAFAKLSWIATEILDGLGLYTTEVYQKSREDVIIRQQQDLLELSTPVVKLFEGIVALPLIGTLDSRRTQVVMESLLEAITRTGSDTAIIDITGVPTVDTLVAQHLMKTVAAARLMGADCIISGIRPQIAQTIVHLAIDLGGITTKATLADALSVALRRRGMQVTRSQAAAGAQQITGDGRPVANGHAAGSN